MGDVQLAGPALNPIVVLGATGSIGLQTLEVAEVLGVPVLGLAAGRATDQIVALATDHADADLAVADPGDRLTELRSLFGDRVSFGPDAVAAVAAYPGTTVVNGIVGAAGLPPSLAALAAGNRLALANKESLVAGGPLVIAAMQSGGGELIPVDSEYSAIWQCLLGEDRTTVRRLVLTASGGPFHGWSPDRLNDATVDEALAHPTWDMGARISIDSATLMNKAFEVIEAHYLFEMPYDRIDVVVHPQSFVHSLVEFTDGVVKAEVGHPDMRKPIQFAITAPQRRSSSRPRLDLAGTTLEFSEPDRTVFPCLDLGYRAGRAGGTAPAVLNAADEIAVAAFLSGRIPFPAIAEVVAAVLDAVPVQDPETIADVTAADVAARAAAERAVGAHG